MEEENLDMTMPYYQKIQSLIQHDIYEHSGHYMTCYIIHQGISNDHTEEIRVLKYLLVVKKMMATIFKNRMKNITIEEYVCKREETIYRLGTTIKLRYDLNIFVWEYLEFDI